MQYTVASLTNLILTHSPLNLLHCFLAILQSPIFANFPRTHKEAMARLEAAQWKATEDIELSQLRKLQVARLMPLPSSSHLLPSKWVYEVNASGPTSTRCGL